MGNLRDLLEQRPDRTEPWMDWVGLVAATITLTGIVAAVIC
jgi:hypothetical protein